MDTQPKETHKDIYKETTEEIAKGNSNEGQAISPLRINRLLTKRVLRH